ncbi:hypothetical protein AVEN_163380-1 [Araneus ventricosus]|uniref:Uncharacterized protein n=1 Tax=Araneus ventricosus TaxID=182803 RepID=A0A4Y2AXS3_ARAVE|nr:hypothetical protein AVEN_98351-1 [Araneus ventricosus]GBN56927.1 hypothetical protein AVEN_163380-1 [Araneus ventricosus]
MPEPMLKFRDVSRKVLRECVRWDYPQPLNSHVSHLHSAVVARFIRNVLEVLQEIKLFEHVEAAAHFLRNVQNYLGICFWNRLFAKGACSLDLFCLNF